MHVKENVTCGWLFKSYFGDGGGRFPSGGSFGKDVKTAL